MLKNDQFCVPLRITIACFLSSASLARAGLVYEENFDAASDLNSVGWFAFSFGGATNAGFLTTSAPDGLADRAALIDVDSTAAASPTSWGAGLGTARTGLAFGTSDLSLIKLSADLFGSEPRPVELLIESRDSGNAVTGTLSFPTSLSAPNVYESFSGSFSSATQTGFFDPAAPTHVFIFRFADVASWGQDTGNVLRIDNLVIDMVPEPSTSLFGTFSVLAVLLRRPRCTRGI